MKAVMKYKQSGSTLIISMIMLIALTLLVVFAIRSGNTNLRIAGNTQANAEATAATQKAIEDTIEKVVAATDMVQVTAAAIPVTTGAKTYTVNVNAMTTCVVELPVATSSLDPQNANDLACFGAPDPDRQITADGKLSTVPSECKSQQWDIAAGVDDGVTGAKVDQVQGISIRVPSTVTCL